MKTTYILRHLHDPLMRDRVQLQLNRGESRYELYTRPSRLRLVDNPTVAMLVANLGVRNITELIAWS